MKKILLLLATYALFSEATQAQTALPYYTGFDDAVQKDGWGAYRIGATGIYEWEYVNHVFLSSPECIRHNYPVGGTSLTDDWFVSPLFQFPSGGKIDSISFSCTGFGMPGSGDTIAIYLLIGNKNPDLATSKILLKDFREGDYIADNEWYQFNDITISPTSEDCYIAFRYATISNWLDIRFDNLYVSGEEGSTNIFENNLTTGKIKVYPNPSSSYIFIESLDDFERYSVYSVSGKKMLDGKYHTCFDISQLSQGSYILELTDKSGNRRREKILKL